MRMLNDLPTESETETKHVPGRRMAILFLLIASCDRFDLLNDFCGAVGTMRGDRGKIWFVGRMCDGVEWHVREEFGEDTPPMVVNHADDRIVLGDEFKDWLTSNQEAFQKAIRNSPVDAQ